jgi:hypothetical protein
MSEERVLATSRNIGSAYLIEDVATCVLGRGGTGTVFRAVSRADGQPVAVKVLDESRLADPDIVTRFVRERDALVRLRHPSLVPVFDLVVEGSLLAVVMELVDGPDLRTQLDATGPLIPEDAARLLAGVLPGLAAAHSGGVVHRDIKPENLLIDRQTGRLRLTDFGIARLTLGTSITRVTSILGTPDYMAPELAEHEIASPASDLYAVGILLYELVSGSRPFTGGHPVAVLRKHIDEAPARPPGMPDALWTLIEQLLAKNPLERPAGAADVAARLLAFAAGMGASAGAIPPLPEVPGHDAATPSNRPLPAWPLAGAATVAPAASALPRPVISLRQDTVHGAADQPAAALEATEGAPLYLDAWMSGLGEQGAEQPVLAALPRPTESLRQETVTGTIPHAEVAAPAGPPPGRRRWLLPVAAASVAAVALAFIGFVTLRRGEQHASAAATDAVQNVFPGQQIADGVVLTRTWTLTGTGFNHLRSTLEIVNGSKAVRRGLVDDVIPKEVARDGRAIHMLTRGEVVVADPVLRFGYALKPGDRVVKEWETTVRSAHTQAAAKKQLDSWAAQQAKDSAAYRALLVQREAMTVIRLKLLPGRITMPSNGRAYVALSGRLANGRMASAAVLSATTYQSSDPRILFVDRGLLTAVHAGSAKILARLGKVTATVVVHVVPATTAAPPPIVRAPSAPGFTNAAALPPPPRPAPAHSAAAAPKPAATKASTPSRKPSPRPSPSPAYTGLPIGTTYTAAVGTDTFSTNGAWTRYTSGGVNAARTTSSPSGCTGSANVDPASAEWSLELPAGTSGYWDVQVFIPGDAYRATHVQYRIAVAGGGYVTKTIAQTSYTSQWATIAHQHMQSGAGVRLTNYEGWTGDCSKVQPINASTVRWVYRG